MDGKDKTNHKTYNKGQYIGNYQVIDSVEEDRFAHIYLAQYQSRQVRVEVLRPPLMSDMREDFLTQTRALMDVEHPYILRLRDAGVDNSNPFLVTDYVPYLTLRQVYKSGSARPLTKLLPYLKQIAEALDALHNKNILHGDIRPENILIDRNNNILLWGFRIKAIEQNRERLNFHQVEAMRDAIAYTAPERIQGKPLPASDQYSLAIIIYEFLCGTVPFTGSYIEIAEKQVQAVPPLLREKGVASRIEQIVMRALSKDAKKRYTTTELFIHALETEVLREQGISAPPRKVPPPVQPIDVSLRQSGTAPAAQPRPVQKPTEAPNPAPAAFNAPQAPLAGSGTMQAASQQAPAQPQSFVPVNPPPAQELPQSALAPRRGDANKVSRRVFAVGLVAVAAVGGAAGWYALSKKLVPPTVPVVTPNETPPATQTTINNKNALIFTGHLAAVNAVAWSPDGTLIASGSDDTFVQVFEAGTGKRRAIYTGHTKEVAAVAWSPNGRLIASAGQDGTVQIWDITGRKTLTYTGHSNRVNSVAWSTDGLFIVSGSEDHTVQVWNSRTGTRVFNFVGHTAGVLCVGWQPNNSSVASGSWDGTLRDWATVQHGNHFAAGDQIFNYGGHGKGEVLGLTWSPNGRFIASAGADQTVQFSNGVNGTPIPPFFTDHRDPRQVNPVRAVDWSPGGNDIVSGDGEGKVLVWHAVARKTFFTYQGHKKAVNAVAWAPDGKRIASASTDTTVQIWQPA